MMAMIRHVDEDKARLAQLRSEILNYISLGVEYEKAIRATLSCIAIPTHLKETIRKEFN